MSAKAKSRNKPAAGSTSTEPATVPEPLMFTAPPVEPIAGGSAVLEVPAPEAGPPKRPLVLRLRAATGKAVATSFASMRTAQATAVERALALITAVDAVLGRSLVTAEQRLLSALRVAPATPAEPAPAEASS